MKIKFNLDGYLPFGKTLEMYDIVIVIGSIFSNSNEYYSQVFLNECLFKLVEQILSYYFINDVL